MSGLKLQSYKNLIINLLPLGRLWKPAAQPTFDAWIEGSAGELCRVDDRVDDLLNEIDPTKTNEALDQWEKVLGLPDECTPDGLDLNSRRTQVVQKLTNIGGLSKEFYEFIGAQLGFTINIDHRLNFLAGKSRAGDTISNYSKDVFVSGDVAGKRLKDFGWRFYFNAELPASSAAVFTAGSLAGDPLRLFSNPLIECTIKKLKPAHAGVTFTFS